MGRAPKGAAKLRALEPRARAEARLAAAIHAARSGGSDELVEFQLAEALREDPDLAALVEDLLMGGLDGGPIRMSAAFARVVRAGRRALARYLWRVRDERATVAHLPLGFVGAAIRLLEGRGRRRAVRRFLEGVERLGQRSVVPAGLHNDGDALFHTAYGPKSRFLFLASGTRAARLELSVRALATARVAVEVNGRPAALVRAGRRWRRARFGVKKDMLSSGLNEVVLRWPEPSRPELPPRFGAVHGFTVG